MANNGTLAEEINRTMHNNTLRSMQQSVMFDETALQALRGEAPPSQMPAITAEQDRMTELEKIAANILSEITDAQFNAKYGLDFLSPSIIHSYMFTQQPRQFTHVFEAFASVASVAADIMKRKKEEIVFCQMFEELIERYTKSRAKPNPVLMETRNSEFCYRLAIVVEAVPVDFQATLGFSMSSLRLLREYEILRFVWEKYRLEMEAKVCSPDHLIGIPMPFEFVNVTGNEYDFDCVKSAIHYFDIRGSYVPVKAARIPGTDRILNSFLSYMSVEKLGPSLSHIADILKSQRKWFSVSTALKILDQILCRLMVLHRYGIILGNMDLKFLNFGVREALNVLYINNYDCAVVAPTTKKPLACFNERYVSNGVLKGTSHFVNDIESAFYIFMALLMPRLPWDEKDTGEKDGSWSPGEKTRNLKLHIDERQKLWDNPNYLDRLLLSNSINTQTSSPAFQGFAFDIIQMVYLKTKEAITTCITVPQQDFMTNTMTAATAAHTAFIGIRKVIVSYFRFENLSNSLRDATCQNKVDRLLAAESVDARALWDLNDWCWNIFETSSTSSRRNSSRSFRF